MAIINGGSVTYSRSVKEAVYRDEAHAPVRETKRLEVTLTFGVPDGASEDTAEEILGHVVERACDMALTITGEAAETI